MTSDLSRRLLVQPLVATITSAVAAAVLLAAWVAGYSGIEATPKVLQQTALAVVLAGTIFLAQRFPIHIRHSTKIMMGSVPLYLMAVMLSPPLAALATLAGVGIAEWATQYPRNSYASDIVTQASRWSLITFCGATLAAAPVRGLVPHFALLLGVAALLMSLDILTAPLQLCPITGERPLRTILECTRGVGVPEVGQYCLGFIGALLAMHDMWAPALLFVPIGLLYTGAKRKKELHDSTRLLLENMADAVDSRDPFTHHHSVRVTEWAGRMLRELDVIGPEAQLIMTAARVHDIGKMLLPDEVIHKHDKLSDAEWKLMETHPAIGAEMIERYPAFARGAGIVRGHHERWDGRGYPDRLSGTDIPFGARILAVVDSFDAMTSDRPYRKGMAAEKAASILQSGAGTQWDPQLVEAFLHLMDQLAAKEIPVVVSVEATA